MSITANLSTELWTLLRPGMDCPCCNSKIMDGYGFDPPNYGHTPLIIEYNCNDCKETWYESWCSACDTECPTCGNEVVAASWEYQTLADLDLHERDKFKDARSHIFPSEEQASSSEDQTKERILQARSLAEHLFSF